MLLVAAACAQAADPLAVRGERVRIPVSVKVEIPSSLDTWRFGFGVAGVGALFEPSPHGLDLVVHAAVRPAAEPPGAMDRLGRLLDRSPFNFGDSGPSQPGLQIELLRPGDIGASIRYRW